MDPAQAFFWLIVILPFALASNWCLRRVIKSTKKTIRVIKS